MTLELWLIGSMVSFVVILVLSAEQIKQDIETKKETTLGVILLICFIGLASITWSIFLLVIPMGIMIIGGTIKVKNKLKEKRYATIQEK